MTQEEQKGIIRFAIATGVFFLVVGIVQIVLLSLRGQTMGKILLGIRIARDPSMDTAKFVHAFLLRVIVPGFIKAVPVIGGLFALIDMLFIFGGDKKCLHDKIASTAVIRV
ncbi:MAG: putative RDD family membrane protein YckC [Verrucomicrobiales bacterium]